MTKTILASNASSPPTTASALSESVRSKLAPVPSSRGAPVVFLAPVTVRPHLPEGFLDIDELVEQEERDPHVEEAIAVGRRDVAENYYATEPRQLAYYRLRNGWSQKELASRVGTSQSYIARLEAGDIDPQLSTLKRLATALCVEPAELLDAIPPGVKQS